MSASKFDKILLIFTITFLFAFTGNEYYLSHNNDALGSILDGFVWMATSVLVVIIALIRFGMFMFKRFAGRSDANAPVVLLVCAVVLPMYPFFWKDAGFYVIDQFRFQMNRSFYIA